MPRKKTAPTRRRFGAVRQYRSGRWTASYRDASGKEHRAPETFETKTDAEVWLTVTEADLTRGNWIDPDAGNVDFQTYALRWTDERGLMPTTDELYRRLLRLHLLPTFAALTLNEITAARVRTWHAERKQATGATTVAKSYRLLKAILQTAVDDDVLGRNPCRIKGAGKEEADERPVATVEQVFELAELMGPRWRFMVFLGAFATLRPEELAELRREDVDMDKRTLRITEASPELNTGKRATGPTKSAAGKRTIHLPTFLDQPLRQHMAWYAEKEPAGLLFVGEKGAPFRRTTFGRKFGKARARVIDLPQNFTFYDLRHTGNTLLAEEGASLKDLMVRMGQSSTRAAIIYQHSTTSRQRELAAKLDSRVRRDTGRTPSAPPTPPAGVPSGAPVVRPIRRAI
ncbi:site-specific integrase [Kitasatospora sp. NBC_01250]|uniref:tyrosine-type recombinase/integrase n=1 Tax=Kitasatospora sp. NBC_01250 TaxID=2903571 RepID=UPI002E353C0F|nr:site-specific integrase [Kitasatospora sp. NBC_01250]